LGSITKIKESLNFPEFVRDNPEPRTTNYEFSQGVINGENVWLIKPIATNPEDTATISENGIETENKSFGWGDINSSGRGLKKFLQDREKMTGEKINSENISVFVDAFSRAKNPTLRYVTEILGEEERHNGLKSIGNEVGFGFNTIELPIGLNGKFSESAYVLGNFSQKELEEQQKFSQKIIANIHDLARGDLAGFSEKIAQQNSTSLTSKEEKNLAKEKENLSKIENALNAGEERGKYYWETKKGSTEVTRETLEEYSETSQARIAEYSKTISQRLEDKLDKLPENLKEQAKFLTKELVATFQNKNYTKEVAFGLTKIVLQKIKSHGLTEQILEIQADTALSKDETILHRDIFSEISDAQLEIILNNGFGALANNLVNGKTALQNSLEIAAEAAENADKISALRKFWQIYPHSTDQEKIKSTIKWAKENKSSFILSAEDKSSILEKAKMLPHRLLKNHLKILENGGRKPEISTPYYDYPWGPAVKQALQDFGAKLIKPSYDIADENSDFFSSPKNLEKLKSEIRNQIKASNGLTILGNRGNVDAKFFTEGEQIDLKSFSQRRTFVEAYGLQVALENKLPIWTICGGTQVAITALGGKIEQLATPQDLRGRDEESMTVKAGSILDLSTHSQKKERGIDLLELTPTFSAHFQGAKVKKISQGSTYLVPTKKFSVFNFAQDEFHFTGLPQGVEVIAVSEKNPEIPKAYALSVNLENGEKKVLGLLMQSHLETDLAQNPVSRNTIQWFFEQSLQDLNTKGLAKIFTLEEQSLIQQIKKTLTEKVSITQQTPSSSPLKISSAKTAESANNQNRVGW